MKRQIGKTNKRRRLYISCIITVLICTSLFYSNGYNTTFAEEKQAAGDDDKQVSEDKDNLLDTTFDQKLEPYYYEMQQKWKDEGIKSGNDSIKINASDYIKKSSKDDVEVGTYGDESDVLIWSTLGGWVEYEVNVAEAGLYEIGAEYFPLTQEDGGSRQSVILGTQVNGEYPYRESRSIELRREFRDKKPQFDDSGSQIRSLVEEITGWKTDVFRDSGGAHVGPLLYHLEKGSNTIRLQVIRESVALKSLTIRPPETHDSYESVKETYPADTEKTGENILIEAEDFTKKNSTSIQVQYDRDPLTTPESLKKIKFNSLGGLNWVDGGQAVTWEFEAPEDGEYKIAFRGLQNYRKNLSVFRTVYIDGKIPFKEMEHYQIPYETGWQKVTLENEEGDPYSFYLEKGKHTMTFEVTHEPFMQPIIKIDKLSKEIKEIAEKLRLASGSREDSFRVWNVKKELPGLIEQLTKMQATFEAMTKKMVEINGDTNNVSQAFESIALDIEALLKDPNEIPNKQVRVGKLQERLEDQRQELMNGPLQIDKYYLAPVKTEFPRMVSTWYEKIFGMFNSLVYSFSGENELADQEAEELNVWMMWGRDYAEELQQLADQQFTPEHGIKVNVNLIQDQNLLILAKAAGIMPDVALGVPSIMPFEMSLRGAAKDLSKLPGAEEVLEQYAPGTLLPYYYDEGYYGIPETINFKVLFYRKDILSQLNLDVPNTWEDVYDMLPTLLQSQYNFFVDPKDYSYMLYQNGAELYSDDGLSSGLDQSDAFKAFNEWTDLFNLHGLDKEVKSFYQQFRKGTFPIGIADFNQYMELLVAAPEILDVWGIAPIPGHVNASGDVVRWAGGTGIETTSMMLFNDTPEEKQGVAWDFIKWYSSAETQTEYGLNLEQFRGETFRWNSANIEAFVKMPWRPNDLAAILEQWKWVRDNPNVPGSYMTTRQLDFSWNQTVLEGGNPRIELEKAVKEINREMKRKQSEFNIIDGKGNVLNPIDLPDITEPWEGVSQFER